MNKRKFKVSHSEPKTLDLSRMPQDKLGKKLYYDSLPLRRQEQLANKNPQARQVPVSDLQEWFKSTPPYTVYLDAEYLFFLKKQYTPVGDTSRFSFENLFSFLQPKLINKINYYHSFTPKGYEKSYNYIHYLHTLPEYRIVTKKLGSSERNGVVRTFGTVTPHICVDVMVDVLEDEKLEHILLISRNNDLEPLLQAVKEYGVRTTIVRADGVGLSSSLCDLADMFIDFDQMVAELNLIAQNGHRKKGD